MLYSRAVVISSARGWVQTLGNRWGDHHDLESTYLGTASPVARMEEWDLYGVRFRSPSDGNSNCGPLSPPESTGTRS